MACKLLCDVPHYFSDFIPYASLSFSHYNNTHLQFLKHIKHTPISGPLHKSLHKSNPLQETKLFKIATQFHSPYLSISNPYFALF